MDDPRLTQLFERMIGKQIGKPVRYDPATGEFVVVSDAVITTSKMAREAASKSDADQQQTEEPKQ